MANLSEVNVHLFLGDKNSCELAISSRRAILCHCTPAFTSMSRSSSRASLYRKQQARLQVNEDNRRNQSNSGCRYDNHHKDVKTFMPNINQIDCKVNTR